MKRKIKEIIYGETAVYNELKKLKEEFLLRYLPPSKSENSDGLVILVLSDGSKVSARQTNPFVCVGDYYDVDIAVDRIVNFGNDIESFSEAFFKDAAETSFCAGCDLHDQGYSNKVCEVLEEHYPAHSEMLEKCEKALSKADINNNGRLIAKDQFGRGWANDLARAIGINVEIDAEKAYLHQLVSTYNSFKQLL